MKIYVETRPSPARPGPNLHFQNPPEVGPTVFDTRPKIARPGRAKNLVTRKLRAARTPLGQRYG